MADSETKSKYPMGHISVEGNLGGAIRYIGKDGVAFEIASSSRDHLGREHTRWFSVTFFGWRVERLMGVDPQKGDRLAVSGDFYGDEYDGREKLAIEAKSVALVGRKRDDDDPRRRRDDDDEEPRSSRRSSHDDDEDEPRSSRRSSRDEDDEPRSSRDSSARDRDDDDEPRSSRRSSRDEDDDEDDRRSSRRSSVRDRGDDD